MDDTLNSSFNSSFNSTFNDTNGSLMNSSVSTPNLPGYRSNKANPKPMTQSFSMVNGVRVEALPDERGNKRSATRSLGSSKSFVGGDTTPEEWPHSNNQMPDLQNRSAIWLNQTGNPPKTFYGYFKEGVNESPNETERVRKVIFMYYDCDGTVEIKERAQENSGIPQAIFLKRGILPKDGNLGGYYSVEDFQIGGVIKLYGKTFKIVDADPNTRRLLGIDDEPIDYPADRYSEERARHMRSETGADTSVPRNVLKSDMKKFMEASLGNTVNNKGLQNFMKYDRVVLRFTGAWDDRASMFGDYNFYTIHYYVANDTIEVLEQHQNNNGKDPYPHLLKRMRLLKKFKVDDPNGRADEYADDDYHHWNGLDISSELEVYNRNIVLISADAATRRFYEEMGRPLSEDIDHQFVTKPPELPRNSEPDHSGFGGAEDSLASCYSLVPKPPKTEFDRQGVSLPSTVLRFQAKMDTTNKGDINRKFVISYYLATNEIQIREPPQRNSGIVGGNYLSKRKMTNDDTGENFKSSDFYAGASVSMKTPHGGANCGVFVVQDVDEHTLGYMEMNPSEFPLSDFDHCCRQLSMMRSDCGFESEQAFFDAIDLNGSGKVSVAEFAPCLKRVFANNGVDVGASFPDQIVITIFRKLDADKSGYISLQEFCDSLL